LCDSIESYGLCMRSFILLLKEPCKRGLHIGHSAGAKTQWLALKHNGTALESDHCALCSHMQAFKDICDLRVCSECAGGAVKYVAVKTTRMLSALIML